jgi:hypothetical protein
MIVLRLAAAAFFLACTCDACVAPPPAAPPAYPALKGYGGLSSVCAAGQAFAGRVVGTSPAMRKQAVPTQMQIDLGNAYCNAPTAFQQRLDRINYVFIDAKDCTNQDITTCGNLMPNGGLEQNTSWGERGAGGTTQIGISAGLWSNGSPESYAIYESDILNSLVQWNSRSSDLTFSPPAGSPATNSWMTVLAALAHEVGHVRWYEINAPYGYGGAYDFTTLTGCNFFAGWNETTDHDPKVGGAGYLEPPSRWRTFGSIANVEPNDHKNPPLLTDFFPPAPRRQPSDRQKAELLARLLANNQPWPTFFGADVPDEDFVETYKFTVLYDAGLTSLPLTIPAASASVDIPAAYASGNKPSLAAKVACIEPLI